MSVTALTMKARARLGTWRLACNCQLSSRRFLCHIMRTAVALSHPAGVVRQVCIRLLRCNRAKTATTPVALSWLRQSRWSTSGRPPRPLNTQTRPMSKVRQAARPCMLASLCSLAILACIAGCALPSLAHQRARALPVQPRLRIAPRSRLFLHGTWRHRAAQHQARARGACFAK